MVKRGSVFCIVLLLIAALVIGCGSPAPTPDPTPDPDGNGAEPRDPFHISIAAGRPGDMWYVVSHALAVLINTRSDWLTADVVASAGVTDNTRMLVGDKEAQANHINVTMIPGYNIWGAEDGYIPLKIASLTMLSETWVTLDPNIKTIADFSGKTVVLPRDAPFGYKFIFENWVKQYATNVNFMYGGIGDRLTPLQDGAAHVGVLPFDYYYPDGYALSSGLIELGARGALYYPNQGNVQQNLADITKACKTDPFVGDMELPPMGMVAPAGALGRGHDEDMAFVSTPIYWSAGAMVPDDVVYEFTRILYEAASKGEFTLYHAIGKGITAEFVVTSFWQTDEDRRTNYHPGALKFYDDNNIELRFFGEWQ